MLNFINDKVIIPMNKFAKEHKQLHLRIQIILIIIQLCILPVLTYQLIRCLQLLQQLR